MTTLQNEGSEVHCKVQMLEAEREKTETKKRRIQGVSDLWKG